MSEDNSRVVVTGGAGFIGSTVVDRLVGAGADVLVLDDLSGGSEANLAGALAAGARLDVIDVRDGARVEKALTAFGPDVVVHLAGRINVRASMTDPGGDAAANILGSINVFGAARVAGAGRVLLASSGGAVYGATSTFPTPEGHPGEPLSAYGIAKLTAERYGQWWRDAHGLDVVALRFANVYGPRQSPHGESGVVSLFCAAVVEGRAPLLFGDGEQTRDLVFVDDVAAATVAAAFTPRLGHAVYNIGTGTEVTINEVIAALARAAAPAVPLVPERLPARAGEVVRSCLDISRARSDLGLAAPTALDAGLRATLAWVRDQSPLTSGTTSR